MSVKHKYLTQEMQLTKSNTHKQLWPFQEHILGRMSTAFKVTSSEVVVQDAEKGNLKRMEQLLYEVRQQFREKRTKGTWSSEVFKINIAVNKTQNRWSTNPKAQKLGGTL